MKRQTSKLDGGDLRGMTMRIRSPWGVVAAILIGLAASAIYLNGKFPFGDDTLHHLARIMQYDALFRQGSFLPRWAPDLGFGFGFPVFNYYAPLSYILAEMFRLVGLDYSTALLSLFTLLSVAGSVGVYLWVSDWTGDWGGLFAATAYAFAPYTLFNVMYRAALAEVLALAVAPFILWSVQRYIKSGRLSFALAIVASYTALMLGHNISAVLCAPFVGIYTALMALVFYWRDPARWRKSLLAVAKVGLLIAASFGLSAFFWLPAYVERDLVQIDRLSGVIGFRYWENFRPLTELFQGPVTIDPKLVPIAVVDQRMGGTPVPISLSLIALAFGLLGAAILVRRREPASNRLVAAFCLFSVAAYALMSREVSLPVWQAISLLSFVQFPWRFVGLASLFLAGLSGFGFALAARSAMRWWPRAGQFLLPAIAGLMAVYGYTWQIVPSYAGAWGLSMTDLPRIEDEAGLIGTTATGEYLPVTVKELPPPSMFEQSRGNERLDQSSLPSHARVVSAHYEPLCYDVVFDASSAFTATFNTFDYAGWRAEIDGQPAMIAPTTPYGLISVLVPPGRRHLTIQFASTPLRDASAVVSIASVIAVIGAVVASGLRARRRPALGPSRVGFAGMRPVPVIALAIVLMATSAVQMLYADRLDTVFRRSPFNGQTIAGLEHPLNVNFGDQMALFGAETDPRPSPDGVVRVESGAPFVVKLYWRLLSQIPGESATSVAVNLIDRAGQRYASHDSYAPAGPVTLQSVLPLLPDWRMALPPIYAGGFNVSIWKADAYAIDTHAFTVPAGTPPGDYTLEVVVYRTKQPDNRLLVMSADGQASGVSMVALSVQITRPGHAPDVSAFAPSVSLDARMGHGICLAGYDLRITATRSGDRFPLTLFWRADQAPGADVQVRVYLSSTNGGSSAVSSIEPVNGYPSSNWAPGDVWRAEHVVRADPKLETGDYMLGIGIGDGSPIALGRLHVSAPPRVLQMPAIDQRAQSSFGKIAQLVGYTLVSELRPGKPVTVTLVWKSLGETVNSYKVFVHVLDEAGRLATSQDAQPANWQRPTTGWIEGEYIIDEHVLALPDKLPAGNYAVQTGLYDELTQQRLTQPDASDTVLLGTIHIP